MNLEITHANYTATVVVLQQFRDLPNCDNVKAAIIFGNSVIVGKDAPVGAVGLFFPVETVLSKEFLGANNQFRKPEFGNADPAAKGGFFEQHGRVKAMKFRGHKSEGFWLPIGSLAYLGVDLGELAAGLEFNVLEGHEICRKYVPKRNPGRLGHNQTRRVHIEDRLIENQFRFHFDTANLRRNIGAIAPTDFISISEKWHGTSAIIANLLIKDEQGWFHRLLGRFGVRIADSHYGLTWSSRKVIKGIEEAKPDANHYYGTDIWGVVAREVAHAVPKGYTLYGEIVGWTPEGSPIQSLAGQPYAYGCAPGQHRFLVYRATFTNPDGLVSELAWPQLADFCLRRGLEMVLELYHGPAKALVAPAVAAESGHSSAWPTLGGFLRTQTTEEWQASLLQHLEATYVTDKMCRHNDLRVPEEGIVVRIDKGNGIESYKLKNFLFLAKESEQLDKADAPDMETLEGELADGGSI